MFLLTLLRVRVSPVECHIAAYLGVRLIIGKIARKLLDVLPQIFDTHSGCRAAISIRLHTYCTVALSGERYAIIAPPTPDPALP